MFDKDLGYLDKFFDKLEAHAASLEPAAGAQLRSLMDEERARWKTITALVNGAPATASEAAAAPAPQAEPKAARSQRDERSKAPSSVVCQPAPPPPVSSAGPMHLTVGSLIKS